MPAGSGSEDYMLIASGPSQYTPSLRAWKDFKDNLRSIIKDQPGWTNVKPGQRRGDMEAWCRLDGRGDAEAAYNYYTQARGVLVHIFKTSRSNGDYRLMKCNCAALFPDVTDRSHSPNRSGIDAGGVNQYLGRTGGPVSTPLYMMPADPYASYPPVQHNYYPTSMQPQVPVYATSANLPVNIREGGGFLTEARGIFISGLDYKCDPVELNQLLLSSTNLSPVESKLHKDPRTGSFKGVATAFFATAYEANMAVHILNNKEHMGKKIHCRLATETTVVGETGPVIANGSNMSMISSSGLNSSYQH